MMSTFETQFKTTDTLFRFIEILGWIAIAGAVAVLIASFLSVRYFPDPWLLAGMFAGTGLIPVIIGQLGRAIVSNTNANLEMLFVMKTVNADALKTTSSNSNQVETSALHPLEGV